MTAAHDVLAIGNAIVDVIAPQSDHFLQSEGIPKGTMRLVSADEASALYARMGPGREISGGSAANTAVGVAALGGSSTFVGRVADDQLGQVFTHDISAAGVQYLTPAAAGGRPTGQCLVIVTPDAQRTMNTYLGACQELDEDDIDADQVRASKIVYVEGYLWDAPAPVRAIQKASVIARAANRKVAITLSDPFCVERHRRRFLYLIDRGNVDMVFANEAEAISLFQTADLAGAIEAFARRGLLAVITRSEKGAIVVHGSVRHEVPAIQPARLVDTTGAGDLFAAGFLTGFTHGKSLRDCAIMGTIAASEVIEHFGARPEADLRARVKARLG